MPAHKIILTVLKGMMLAAAFVVLWLVLRGVGLRNVFEAMRSVDRTSLAASAALFFAVFWCWTLRWQQIMKPQSRPNLLALFPIFMAGVFGNLVSPGARVGSEPIRAYYMSKVFGGDKAGHFGTAMADKFTYTVVFVAFLLVSATRAIRRTRASRRRCGRSRSAGASRSSTARVSRPSSASASPGSTPIRARRRTRRTTTRRASTTTSRSTTAATS